MGKLRTANKRALRRHRHDPVKCAKHGLPYRGNGWVYAAGLRFAMFECPRPACKNFKLIDAGGEITPASEHNLW